ITVLSFSITPRPPTAPLFPYTTLFRSRCWPPASTSTALSPRSRVADGALLPRHLRAERDDGRRGGGRRHPGRRAAGRPPAGLRLPERPLQNVHGQGRRDHRPDRRLVDQ